MVVETQQPPFSPMYSAKPGFPRPSRQKQIPSSRKDDLRPFRKKGGRPGNQFKSDRTHQPPFSPIRSGPRAASRPSRQKKIPSSPRPLWGEKVGRGKNRGKSKGTKETNLPRPLPRPLFGAF